MGHWWQGDEQGHKEAAPGEWAALALLYSPPDRWTPAWGSGLRRRLAWPGAAGRTAASAPQAPAGSGGSGPGGWGALYQLRSKNLGPQPSAPAGQYLYGPGGPVTQGANGVALYLLADLPQRVDLSRPGVPPHKAGHHLVHPVHTCSHSSKRGCDGLLYLGREGWHLMGAGHSGWGLREATADQEAAAVYSGCRVHPSCAQPRVSHRESPHPTWGAHPHGMGCTGHSSRACKTR